MAYEDVLIRRVTEIYQKIAGLPSLKPSDEVNSLFTELVHLCIPHSSIEVPKLSREVRDMVSELTRLCGHAEGLLEAHYSAILGTFEKPLDHVTIFPYYENYVKLSLMEYTLLTKHVTRPIKKVAFVGSGPLPLTTIVLASSHLRSAQFDNYDFDFTANTAAAQLVEPHADLAGRVSFRTADIMNVGEELKDYDVVFLAALVGMGRAEKGQVVAHLAANMASGALLVVRSAAGARAFLYPVVEPAQDLGGFDVLEVYHPVDDVINSVIVARRRAHPGVINLAAAAAVMSAPPCLMLPCKCSEKPAFNPLSHRCMIEELAIDRAQYLE